MLIRIILTVTLLWLLSGSAVQAADNAIVLTATPQRCVSLHKGQTCYQDITFQWQAIESTSVCLINLRTEQQIACWNNANNIKLQYAFASANSQLFALINASGETVATTEISVAWVYKSSKRTKDTWRLF